MHGHRLVKVVGIVWLSPFGAARGRLKFVRCCVQQDVAQPNTVRTRFATLSRSVWLRQKIIYELSRGKRVPVRTVSTQLARAKNIRTYRRARQKRIG